MSQRTVVLGVVSDLHAGSTIGLCPADGVHLDDGGSYMPSKEQLWLWEHWLAGWGFVQDIVKREDADFGLVVNGDATDGNHHGTVQILSGAEGAHIKCATECLRVPLAGHPKWVWVVRGTEAHVGKSGGLEEGMAVALNREGAPIQRDVNTGAWSSWYVMLDIHGKLIDFAHHGRMGQRAHTRAGYARHFAHDIWTERMLRGERAPAVAVRSHYHTFEDSGPPHPTRPTTRVIQMPAWQLKTAFVWRVGVESLSDVGMVALVIRPEGPIEVHPYVISPSRGATWKLG